MAKITTKQVLFDSSALLSACHSETGAASVCMYLVKRALITGYINQHIIEETRKNAITKFGPRVYNNFESILNKFSFVVLPDPEPEQVEYVSQYIVKKDAPILASALKSPVTHIVTHDKKDFMQPRIHKANISAKIMLPAEFIKECRREKLI